MLLSMENTDINQSNLIIIAHRLAVNHFATVQFVRGDFYHDISQTYVQTQINYIILL